MFAAHAIRHLIKISVVSLLGAATLTWQAAAMEEVWPADLLRQAKAILDDAQCVSPRQQRPRIHIAGVVSERTKVPSDLELKTLDLLGREIRKSLDLPFTTAASFRFIAPAQSLGLQGADRMRNLTTAARDADLTIVLEFLRSSRTTYEMAAHIWGSTAEKQPCNALLRISIPRGGLVNPFDADQELIGVLPTQRLRSKALTCLDGLRTNATEAHFYRHCQSPGYGAKLATAFIQLFQKNASRPDKPATRPVEQAANFIPPATTFRLKEGETVMLTGDEVPFTLDSVLFSAQNARLRLNGDLTKGNRAGARLRFQRESGDQCTITLLGLPKRRVGRFRLTCK